MKDNSWYQIKRNTERAFKTQFWNNCIKQWKGFFIIPLVSIMYCDYERGLYIGWLNWLYFIGTVSVEVKE